ncbi:MAG: hypothetical protein JWQ43_2073 [Glaciihabitans sp.]|nr:hypothetical protein [Glaciihabitans sp.]
MKLLSPADVKVPIAVTSGSGTDPDVTIRVGRDDDASFSIRTIERIGIRMNDRDHVLWIEQDAAGMAALAVSEFRLSKISVGTPPDEARALMRQIAIESTVVDWDQWEWTRMEVDGIGFALRVRQLDAGFVAIADLGAHVVTMYGAMLPADRNYTLHRRVDPLT